MRKCFFFFLIILCYSKHTHGFPAQTACRPPSLPGCDRSEGMRFTDNSSIVPFPLHLEVVPPGGVFGPLCFCPTCCLRYCDKRVQTGMPNKDIRAHQKYICRSLMPDVRGCLLSSGSQAKLHSFSISHWLHVTRECGWQLHWFLH